MRLEIKMNAYLGSEKSNLAALDLMIELSQDKMIVEIAQETEHTSSLR